MPKLKCERGEVYVWNPRQFYQKIVCPMCDERGGGHKELTVPHFRKHLEQVHTMEEVESVHVCRLCHRNSVSQKRDKFDGLVSTLSPEAFERHNARRHPPGGPATEFISIYEKQKKSNNDSWGLSGIERDPEKVYKYASKKKKEEETTVVKIDTVEEKVNTLSHISSMLILSISQIEKLRFTHLTPRLTSQQ